MFLLSTSESVRFDPEVAKISKASAAADTTNLNSGFSTLLQIIVKALLQFVVELELVLNPQANAK
jgi:hypothetical protein